MAKPTKAWQGIVKVQRPISSNEKVPIGLVYNQQVTILFEMPLNGNFLRRFKKDVFKFFCHARVVNGVLHLDSDAPWQDW